MISPLWLCYWERQGEGVKTTTKRGVAMQGVDDRNKFHGPRRKLAEVGSEEGKETRRLAI